MADKPILFSAPMVHALLNGRKTQARRVLKPQPRVFEIDERGTPCQVGVVQIEGDAFNSIWLGTEQAGVLTGQKVNFAIGDRLWAMEAFAKVGDVDDDCHACPDMRIPAYYRADQVDPERQRWRPSIHMPRWASRLTLTVTDVRVQRLQDISEADALAEGRGVCPSCGDSGWINSGPDGGWQCNAYQCGDSDKDWFADLWNSINGPDAWAANPWVVALTFDVHRCNIDAMP